MAFCSSSRAKPQTQPQPPAMYMPVAQQAVAPEHMAQGQGHSSSLNNDTYSGFFSGTSLSQSELDESVLLTREETKLLKRQKVGCSAGECTICFERYSKGQVIRNLPCGHMFHYKCMKPWLKISSYCPLCRFDLKTFCSEKIETQTRDRFLNENAPSGLAPALVLELPKKEQQLHSQTFIESGAHEEQAEFLGRDLDVSAIQMETSEGEGGCDGILKNEELLRFRVMGCETDSNVSFFGKKEESTAIHFGIEDDISEIGL